MRHRFLALMCALTLLVAAVPTAAALEGEALRAADALATLGLVDGTGDGYALDAPATRGQAAVLLVRLAGAQEAAAADSWFAGFRDVPAWAQEAVDYAVHQGWMTGVTALDFQPDAPITADAWCAALLRMLGYAEGYGPIAEDGAATFAQHIGLVSRSWPGTLCRGALFQIMLEAATFPYQDGDGTPIRRLVEVGRCSRAAANALGLMTDELSARQVAERCMAAVFQLDGYKRPVEIDAQLPSTGASGFFISADGLAVTNYHSIQDLIHATVTLSTGETYPVESVVWYDTEMDLAVLRISRIAVDHRTTPAFAYLELAGSEDLYLGEQVYALGSPLSEGLAVSQGVVSAIGRVVERYSIPCVMNTADISQGSSGGALLNVYGQVVGVTAGAYTYGNGMYLAVPVDPLFSLDLSAQGQTLREVRDAEERAS